MSAMRLLTAHLELLKAELAVTGREIGLIVGLALAALSLALLIVTLVYTGTWLFLGEWLFGSLGWGVLHGTLFTIAIIVPIALNLAGGWFGAWVRGLLIGLLVTIGLSLLFASNLARSAAVAAGDQLEVSLALEPAVLPSLVGLVTGGLVVGLAAVRARAQGGGRVQVPDRRCHPGRGHRCHPGLGHLRQCRRRRGGADLRAHRMDRVHHLPRHQARLRSGRPV